MQRLSPRLLIALLAVLLATGCSAPLPKHSERTTSVALPPVAETKLDQAVSEHLSGHRDNTGLRVFGHSLDGFVARIMLADMAERSIDAQYYLIDEGTTGTLFPNSLLKAAQRGVRVRLLLDDIDLAKRDALLLGLAAQENVELRVFTRSPVVAVVAVNS